jgi:hypothetical protein
MKKLGTALLCMVMAIGLAGCSSESATARSTTNTESPASSTPESTTTASEAHTYTEDDVNATITKCAPLSENGADLVDDITSPTKVLSLVSLGGVLSKGVESNVFRCAFEELSIPDDIIQKINQPLGSEQQEKVGNLNIVWTNKESSINLYMSTEDMNQ